MSELTKLAKKLDNTMKKEEIVLGDVNPIMGRYYNSIQAFLKDIICGASQWGGLISEALKNSKGKQRFTQEDLDTVLTTLNRLTAFFLRQPFTMDTFMTLSDKEQDEAITFSETWDSYRSHAHTLFNRLLDNPDEKSFKLYIRLLSDLSSISELLYKDLTEKWFAFEDKLLFTDNRTLSESDAETYEVKFGKSYKDSTPIERKKNLFKWQKEKLKEIKYDPTYDRVMSQIYFLLQAFH